MHGEFFDIPPPDELVFISFLHGRRGVPQRLRVPPWTGADLLLRQDTRSIRCITRPRCAVIANAVGWTAQPGLAPYRPLGDDALAHWLV